ncbi:MAG TPA: MraY family glycosyltransferase [Thermoanaerobaculia bacterium]|jgi:UDP-GlcNAc:undecaprenyl-phosphate GlcNAc-1-phosphate transferase
MLAALIAFAVAAVATPLARAVAVRSGFVNAPNPLVQTHTRPVAYLGGAAILVAVAAASLLIRPYPSHILIVATLFGILGLVDDLRPFRASEKLIAQLAIAFGAVALLRQPLWEALVVVVLVNCFNVTDVCDGLVAGLSAIAFAGWSLLTPGTPVALVFGAACIGFLLLNFPDASIYLGDCGSHVLGAAFAAMACESMRAPLTWNVIASAVLLAAIPIFETLFLIAERRRHGRAWWKGSRDHYALRLQSAGWSKRQVLAASYSAASLLVVIAFLVRNGRPLVALTALATVLLMASFAWRRLSALVPRA